MSSFDVGYGDSVSEFDDDVDEAIERLEKDAARWRLLRSLPSDDAAWETLAASDSYLFRDEYLDAMLKAK